MYSGKWFARNGPTAPHANVVTAAKPPHTANTLAACAGCGIALTTAFRYPGADQGGSNEVLGVSSVSVCETRNRTEARRWGRMADLFVPEITR
jgi:hypothetical protein